MAARLAINGFGRIGRQVFRQLMEDFNFEVVAVNDIADLENLAYLLRHDSVYWPPKADVRAEGEHLRWNDRRVRYLSVPDPRELPWRDLGVDLVIEASGRFTGRAGAAQHLEAGAERVLVTAPTKDADLTVCYGINHDRYDPGRHQVVSNASCTTNCLAPVALVLDERFGIAEGFMTTVHAVTSSQKIVDGPSGKWRRGRAAMASIIPTSTGAARATTQVLPQLEGKLAAMAMRVPVLTGSVIDFVVRTERPVTADAVNDAFREAAESDRLRGILGVTDEPLVSADIVGTHLSALVDATTTVVLGDRAAKVLAWYDNEWGYSRRVADMVAHMAR